MIDLKSLVVAFCLLLGAAFAAQTPLLAQKSAEKISLSAHAKHGIVLMKVDRDVARLDVWLQKADSSGFGSRVYTVTGDETGTGEYYIARTLGPARYRIVSLWEQKAFGIEVEASTVEFDVRPGRVTYLGKLNSGELLALMRAEALAAGKTRGGGGSGFLSESGAGKVVLTGRDEITVAEAREFASRVMRAAPGQFDLAELY